ncbi:MAG: 1-deoxy-D-xylulose-5-phosphate reductoisomerase [Bacillota bacterium]
MKKRIALLGATGSIGTTALNVIRQYKNDFEVMLIANNTNINALEKLINEFHPEFAYNKAYKRLYYKGKIQPFDKDFISKSESYKGIDTVINGIDGIEGLAPSIAALTAGKTLATANKESFVSAGRFINLTKEKYNSKIIPLDSEHSTVWQCIGNERDNVESIILTASGGAFRDWDKKRLKDAKAKDALKHPNWVMGKKVTIDCATLMNKGMEIIEAKYLFNTDKIEVIQHDESIVHSMVRFKDNSIMAGLSSPDMTLPIQYALTYPQRKVTPVKPLDLTQIKKLNFGVIDEEKFPCVNIAKKVFKMGEVAGAIMNASNEAAVNAYLGDKIGFYDIPKLITQAIDRFYFDGYFNNIEKVYSIHKDAYEYTCKRINTGEYK